MLRGWRTLSRFAKAVVLFSATGWALLLLSVPAFFLLPSVGDTSAEALQYSVAREVGGSVLFDIYDCEPRRGGVWHCEVADSQDSGSATYRVRRDGRCWRARKVSGDRFEEGPMLKPRASGCVNLRDQLRPLEKVVSSD